VTETVDLREFVGGYIAESEQLVGAATGWLLEIEQSGGKSPPRVRDLFRALHTLKGLAGMMGVQPIVDLAHAFETVLRAADNGGGRLGKRAVELGLITVREIAARVRCVAEQRAVPAAPDAVLGELARVDIGGTAAPGGPVVPAWERKLSPSERQQLATALAAGKHAYTISFAPSDENTARGITITSVRAALGQVADIIKVAPLTQPAGERAPAGLVFELLVTGEQPADAVAAAIGIPADRVSALATEAPSPPSLPELVADDVLSPIGRSIVRVELVRLDELQEQLAGLVVTRFRIEKQLAKLAAQGLDVRTLREIVDTQNRQLRELRRSILRVRMVKVSESLEPLTLLARSLNKPGIKELKLELDVGTTELDKAVSDRLLPGLVHLVRNAFDHAIEPIADRHAAGKPSAGVVRIHCREGSGNQIVLTVSDDGRGVDREALARRAGRRIDDDQAALEAMTTPGLSTRDEATETSGRGLGMDIVRRIVVGDLGGELAMSSEPGAGTTFTLEVPLTIAIIEVFSFECGSQPFVVPVASVEEILELSEQSRIASPAGARGKVPLTLCERRGRPLPVVSLGVLLHIDGGASANKALVVRRNAEPLAFAVDRMLGRHEVVVRPIDDELARVAGVAGATDLGDGKPTLVLDLVELGASIRSWRAEAS
jgi:two-component system chemotaxis sensor kinase CheA